MDYPPLFLKLWSLSKDLGDGAFVGKFFIYHVKGVRELVQLKPASEFSIFGETNDALREGANFARPWVLSCCQLEFDQIIPPQGGFLADEAGRKWWSVVIGSGPVRKMGYAICATTSAKDEAEAANHIFKIQQIFNNDRPVDHGSENIASQRRWIEFPNSFDLRNKDSPPVLEHLRRILIAWDAHACAVYCVEDSADAIKLELWGSYTPFAKTLEHYQEAAAGYFKIPTTRACALNKDRVSSPSGHLALDKEGRKLFAIIIASGAVRKAGYAISALLRAVDQSQAAARIVEIQRIFG